MLRNFKSLVIFKIFATAKVLIIFMIMRFFKILVPGREDAQMKIFKIVNIFEILRIFNTLMKLPRILRVQDRSSGS